MQQLVTAELFRAQTVYCTFQLTKPIVFLHQMVPRALLSATCGWTWTPTLGIWHGHLLFLSKRQFPHGSDIVYFPGGHIKGKKMGPEGMHWSKVAMQIRAVKAQRCGVDRAPSWTEPRILNTKISHPGSGIAEGGMDALLRTPMLPWRIICIRVHCVFILLLRPYSVAFFLSTRHPYAWQTGDPASQQQGEWLATPGGRLLKCKEWVTDSYLIYLKDSGSRRESQEVGLTIAHVKSLFWDRHRCRLPFSWRSQIIILRGCSEALGWSPL